MLIFATLQLLIQTNDKKGIAEWIACHQPPIWQESVTFGLKNSNSSVPDPARNLTPSKSLNQKGLELSVPALLKHGDVGTNSLGRTQR
ncbi:uncharacterized protein ATNIH1004_000891 [Aspergillus tanneri]|uniref:Uncharacterized protein n=1 Tax=Aspergillus tanneri TaxID=1220188 RepID=A0A5M9MXZ9_9EURO|nr:uncharacterized protein ATNIH1004_000891 [Aspergillus tanneri]KAA8651991.1 hypothetical protein ATNIH1004_000891 [Aspergillus tanneri]